MFYYNNTPTAIWRKTSYKSCLSSKLHEIPSEKDITACHRIIEHIEKTAIVTILRLLRR